MGQYRQRLHVLGSLKRCACPTLGSFNTDGWLGGGQIGYNWDLVGFLVGVEGDFAFSEIDGDSIFSGKNASSSLDWLATIRARGGFLITPDTLLYGTVGIAWGDWTDRFNPISISQSWSDVYTGWTVGGGVETKLTNAISIKVEYLYIDFGNESNSFNVTSPPLVAAGSAGFDHELHTVKVGLNLKLN
jgi:outer membrane immunogenic protein